MNAMSVDGVRCFIDSNTFLYTIEASDQRKQACAQDWLRRLAETDTGVANLQVLNEMTSVLLRKKQRFEVDDPFMQIDLFRQFGDQPISNETCHLARVLHRSFRYSWWDCLLLASASELGCSHFLSEDLQDGQVVEGLTIIDPFAHTPDEIIS